MLDSVKRNTYVHAHTHTSKQVFEVRGKGGKKGGQKVKYIKCKNEGM